MSWDRGVGTFSTTHTSCVISHTHFPSVSSPQELIEDKLFPILPTTHIIMLVSLSPSSLNCLPSQKHRSNQNLHVHPKRFQFKIQSMAKQTSESEGPLETIAIIGGIISTPVIGWSLYTLKTTGCGLPPGPGGSIGALEGVSYLVVVGIVGWSFYTKSKTGSGLPTGPFGLLGAVEGLSYLSLLAILVVFGLQFLDQGSIPGPLPTYQCFG